MNLLLIIEVFVGLAFAATGLKGVNLFIRQDVGCDLIPCVTDDCDLLACGAPGWGVNVDCACCGGVVGCNIPLGHTCGTEDGEPVCFTGNTAASSAVAPASSSAIASSAPSSSSSSPAAASSSASDSGSGSSHASDHAAKNGGTSMLFGNDKWNQVVGAAAIIFVTMCIVVL